MPQSSLLFLNVSFSPLIPWCLILPLIPLCLILPSYFFMSHSPPLFLYVSLSPLIPWCLIFPSYSFMSHSSLLSLYVSFPPYSLMSHSSLLFLNVSFFPLIPLCLILPFLFPPLVPLYLVFFLSSHFPTSGILLHPCFFCIIFPLPFSFSIPFLFIFQKL